MTESEKTIGTITDAERRYGFDAAGAWAAILCGWRLQSPDGGVVILAARPEDRQGTKWIVKEVRA